MSWILGDITLPSPQGYQREPVLIVADVQMIDGSTKRDIVRRKYRHVLTFTQLTQTEVNSILSEYNKNIPISFSVSETNYTISAVNVLVSLGTREYNTAGGDFREDLKVVLVEV